jgi:hypothetical protein
MVDWQNNRTHWQGDPDSKIEVLVQGNPKKMGSKAHARFALYRPNMSVSGYVAACKKAPNANDALLDITCDLARGYIRLVPTSGR